MIALVQMAVLTAAMAAAGDAVVSAELKVWHPVSVTFVGPQTGETAQPNPFRRYRLDVTFSHGEKQYTVPGYFAADGNAAESGAAEGNCWRARFTPDAEGRWTFRASFRGGEDVAASADPNAGKPLPPDGASGEFTVAASDKSGRDHRGKGILRHAGGHYLQFAGSGEFFLKGGADSPENFLAYAEFDGTEAPPGRDKKRRQGEAAVAPLHLYRPHVGDWRPGDPTWRGARGKGIVGALNYLAAQEMNSVYFLTMNVGGDGKDVWPWIDDEIRDRFDTSKLDQWEIVFSHMDRLGIMLHVITQEQENDQLLDDGELGTTRKLYYRELVARFGHHLVVVWNLGEENTNTPEQQKQFAQYIDELDAYGHPVVVHTFPGKYEAVYGPLLGYRHFHGPSLQMGDAEKTHEETVRWVRRSAEAGHKWFVSLDEIGPANTGVKPDADDPGHDDVRKHALWGNLMGGGAGCEWYFGYNYAHNDLNCEDWRSRQRMWDQTRWALEFFRCNLPFEQMRPADELLSTPGAYCLAAEGEIYAVYLPDGGTTDLKLADGRYRVRWYNPRAGGELADGTVLAVTAPGPRSLGQAPSDRDQDWAVLVVRE